MELFLNVDVREFALHRSIEAELESLWGRLNYGQDKVREEVYLMQTALME